MTQFTNANDIIHDYWKDEWNCCKPIDVVVVVPLVVDGNSSESQQSRTLRPPALHPSNHSSTFAVGAAVADAAAARESLSWMM